jgi:uncharacterized membrane protein YciS (DUF1049 family)
MSPEDLKQLATLIAQGQFSQSWLLYVMFGLLLLVTTSIAAFFGAYFKTRGELSARKIDIDKIVDELKKTTTVVEIVKQGILFADWHNREVTQTKLAKLEQLMEIEAEIETWVDNVQQYYLFDGPEVRGQLVLDRLQLIQRLYFPELRDCTDLLLNACRQLRLQGIHVRQDRLARLAPTSRVEHTAPTEEQSAAFISRYKTYQLARVRFENEVSSSMESFLASREKALVA